MAAETLRPGGLSTAEARERLARVGRNALADPGPTPAWRVFLRQFQGALIWLLFGAAAVAAVLGERVDAIAIFAILLVNGIIGFVQESRAEQAVRALKAMTAPHCRVLRDGHLSTIPTEEVVPGDVVVLEAGDLVAADARLLETHHLATNEAALTGESAPVEKSVAEVRPDAPLAERTNRVFMGTAVAAGTGQAVVEATGMSTELGKIATLIARAADEQAPLQRRLAQTGRTLMWLCLAIVAVVAISLWLHGAAWSEVLLASVSLAVAAVPEGLTAMVTVALAIGVQRMAARNVLVRRMAAVEALGSTTVICTDKTGTLTTGVMTVREVWGDPEATLFAAAANCDAELDASGTGGVGDTTELALLAAAKQRGISKDALERAHPRVDANPFDSVRKRMSTFRADGTLYVKGAGESVLPLCEGDVAAAEAEATRMAASGLRVMAIATGLEREERGLRLVGLVGMADPPREDAKGAVQRARAAGIQTVMITGDHPRTAEAIGRELGIVQPGERPEQWIHARATPEDKIRIVREWKAKGAIVAMTGDGVNDAPALKEAHVGIAMGRTGTEVTREASDLVLADDNFASIVNGVEEGRGIYDNIRKTLVYLLAGNLAELAVMLSASVVGLPIPLSPVQLLWINLVTDGLPALALILEPPARDLLSRPPRPPTEPILARPQWFAVARTGMLEAAVVLATYVWALSARSVEEAHTFAFLVLVVSEVLRVFAARDVDRLHWEVGAFTNPRLVAVVIFSLLLQLSLQYLPWTREIFGLTTLTPPDVLLAVGLGFIPVSVLELRKLLVRAMMGARARRV